MSWVRVAREAIPLLARVSDPGMLQPRRLSQRVKLPLAIASSVASKRQKEVVMVAALLLGACTPFGEPVYLDPTPYLGCYATGNFKVKVTPRGVAIGGQSFGFKIEARKVGVGVTSPFILFRKGDSFSPRAADEHFYRFSSEEGERILIVTDQDSYVYKLRQQPCL